MLSGLLRVAVLCSKRAPGLDALLEHHARGVLYDVTAVVTTEPAFAECGVPVIPRSIRSFYGDAPIRDMAIRRRFDAGTADILRALDCDVVVMLGYLYVTTEPLLQAFPGRMLNVHDSDLTLRRPDGRARYRGLHSTRDAIVAGEKETRSSVHFVTADLDDGPVIARSRAFPVAPFAHEAALHGEQDIVRAYAYAQREWMMRRSWADLVVFGLERVPVLKEATA
jgi:folate-dependent phosphoribosylglycinamide formyltransferase PurN